MVSAAGDVTTAGNAELEERRLLIALLTRFLAAVHMDRPRDITAPPFLSLPGLPFPTSPISHGHMTRFRLKKCWVELTYKPQLCTAPSPSPPGQRRMNVMTLEAEG